MFAVLRHWASNLETEHIGKAAGNCTGTFRSNVTETAMDEASMQCCQLAKPDDGGYLQPCDAKLGIRGLQSVLGPWFLTAGPACDKGEDDVLIPWFSNDQRWAKLLAG